MKKIISLILVFALFMTSAVLLTGCKDKDVHRNSAAVLIIGRTANTKDNYVKLIRDALDAENSVLKKCVSMYKEDGVYHAKPQIAVIIADGSPSVQTIEAEEKIASKSDKALNKQIRNYFDSLLERIDGLYATEPEADLLGAITQGANYLHDLPSDTERYMFIFNSGYSTSGRLNLRALKNLQNMTAEEVVSTVDAEELVDLSDINVFFDDLGNIGGFQTDLNSRKIQTLIENIWALMLKKLNCTEFNNYPNDPQKRNTLNYKAADDNAPDLIAGEGGQGLPYVSPIIFKEEPGKTPVPRTLNARFIGNSTAFVSEADATNEIRELGDIYKSYMDEEPDAVLYIVATVARVYELGFADEETDTYSTGRAKRVAGLLCSESGVDRRRIVVIDAGTTDFSWTKYIENNKTIAEAEAYERGKQNGEVFTLLENVQAKHRQFKMFFSTNTAEFSEIEGTRLLNAPHVIDITD